MAQNRTSGVWLERKTKMKEFKGIWMPYEVATDKKLSEIVNVGKSIKAINHSDANRLPPQRKENAPVPHQQATPTLPPKPVISFEEPKEFDHALYERLTSDLEFVTRLFKTQGPESSEHRKDLNCYKDFMHVFGSLYGDIFEQSNEVYNSLIEENLPKEIRSEIAGLQKGELIIKDQMAFALGMGKKYKKIYVSRII